MAARSQAPSRAGAAAALVVAALLVAGCGDEGDPSVAPAASSATTLTPERTARRRPSARSAPLGARLVRPALLRARPRGRAVARLGLRTRFGSPQVLAVVARRGDWLGVLSEHRPNGRVGWIPRDAARLVSEPYALRIDLSARRLTVLRRGRVVRRAPVAIGAPGTETPTGRFAVTDLLRTRRADSPYGCCIVALSGRQPDLPQGWPGGDRLAVHGTSDEASVGQAASSGCLRARRADVRWLLRHVTLGAPVTIRA